MLKNNKCFLCAMDLTVDNYKMVAFDTPYLNIFVCKDCSKDTEKLIESVKMWYNLNRKENKNGKK